MGEYTAEDAEKHRVIDMATILIAAMILGAGWDIPAWPVGRPYVDCGASAIDNYDGDLTSRITVTNRVDWTRIGTYYVTYSVSDASGNTATAVRRVSVVDGEIPVITLRGAPAMSVKWLGKFTDPGATAIDNYDGDISARIKRTGNVVSWWPGRYTLAYDVTDASGNSARPVIRTVTVK